MCVFARFKLFACFQFDFSSANDNIILCSDWSLGLLRFEFLDTRLKFCPKAYCYRAVSNCSSCLVLQTFYYNSAGVTRNLRISNLTSVKSLELFKRSLIRLLSCFSSRHRFLLKSTRSPIQKQWVRKGEFIPIRRTWFDSVFVACWYIFKYICNLIILSIFWHFSFKCRIYRDLVVKLKEKYSKGGVFMYQVWT